MVQGFTPQTFRVSGVHTLNLVGGRGSRPRSGRALDLIGSSSGRPTTSSGSGGQTIDQKIRTLNPQACERFWKDQGWGAGCRVQGAGCRVQGAGVYALDLVGLSV